MSDDKSHDAHKSGASAAARLRDRIDRGGAGDKVAFSDPAAAPLGTDAEAAGTPPTEEQVRLAAEAEVGRSDTAEHKGTPGELQGSSSRNRPLILVLVATAIALVSAWLTLAL